MSNQLVKSWMSTPVTTVTEETPLSEARKLIADKKIRALPVMRGDKLVGIITRRGLLRLDLSILGEGSWHLNADLEDEKVGRVMTLKPLTILPDSSMPKAARIMLENKITALPVIENNRLLGIITNSDILRFLLATYEELKKPIFIKNYMTDEVVSIEKTTSLLEAHRLMGTNVSAVCLSLKMAS
jgi:acetoin utilization protein AcuB